MGGSLNAVERCLLSDSEGQRDVAYLKSEQSEPFFTVGSNGDIQTFERFLNQQGIEVIRPRRVPRDIQTLFEHAAQTRLPWDAAMHSEMSSFYQIPSEKLPLSRTEYTGRYTAPDHGVRSEYASSILDTLVGFNIIPQTAVRKEKNLLCSLQIHKEGDPFTYELLDSLGKEGSKHPAAKSLMRLSCMDFLLKSSDRNPQNFLYDEETQSFHGIDNGLANGFSIHADLPQADGSLKQDTVPADGYRSTPIELTEMHPDWKLDPEAMDQCRSLFDRIKLHMLYREGYLSPEQADALPEDVKEGRDAKILSDTYRFLHERTDEQGHVIPETTTIAHKEALEFLRRLNYLSSYGRPPHFSDEHLARTGLAAILEARQKVAKKS